nr:MAG TPA: hypothetical protein [Caudoviricetes sp.]
MTGKISLTGCNGNGGSFYCLINKIFLLYFMTNGLLDIRI